MTQIRVRFGVDRVCHGDAFELRGVRIGLLTNDPATTAALPHPVTPSRLALVRAGLQVTVLFSPEHGLGAAAADGAAVGDVTDPLTGLPVRSLYGETVRPTPQMLEGIDVLVADLPDVGARFYTYLWTLSHAMEAAAAARMPLWVLDRPNPLGGDLSKAEGPLFGADVKPSLVGRWPIPVRHALTMGELARLWNAERKLGLDLHVVPVDGWHRASQWPELGMPFVPTSPAMPSYETALLYPGTCLLEGLAVAEGRGTSVPFRVTGAPWMDGGRLSEALNDCRLPGVVARPVAFTPTSGRFNGKPCAGAMLHVTDADAFRPVATGLALIHTLRRVHPSEFAWATYPSLANWTGADHFDRLLGTTDGRRWIESGADDVHHAFELTRIPDWSERCRTHLLYT
jgi:uncharacterized protein YbbC (DUF1343 family)